MLFHDMKDQLGLFTEGDKEEKRFSSLDEIKEVAVECERCELHEECIQTVFGTGNSDAGLMFVGEGPGKREDEQGEPFVGKAGQLFNKILKEAEIEREDVYISNIVKCRPSGNRNPKVSEMKSCLWFLAQEIRLIKPMIIVPLGSIAVRGLLDPDGRITKLRGNWIEREGYYLLPTFHPAALLRNEEWKKPTWHDFLKIKKAYKRYLELREEGKL